MREQEKQLWKQKEVVLVTDMNKLYESDRRLEQEDDLMGVKSVIHTLIGVCMEQEQKLGKLKKEIDNLKSRKD